MSNPIIVNIDEFEVSKEPLKTATKTLIYGLPKTGKSFFAGYAPRPFFLAVEKGCEAIKGAKKFYYTDDMGVKQVRVPKNWDELLRMMAVLKDKDFIAREKYATVILDSGMFVDQLIIDDILLKDSKKHDDTGKKSQAEVLNSVGKGFMEGHQLVLRYWKEIIAWADKLNSRNIDVIVIAHAKKVKQTESDGTEYKRMEPDLNVALGGAFSVSDLLCARFDNILYIESKAQLEKVTGYRNKEINVPVTTAVAGFNRPEIKLYTRGTNYFLAGVRSADIADVNDVYDINVFDPATCRKVWEDLKK